MKSALVEQLLWQIKAAGLVEPELEYQFNKPRTRHRFDMAYLHHRIAVEVEGGIHIGGRHVQPQGFETDCWKYNEALLQGWKVIRVTSGQIKSGQALTWLTRALAGEGQ